jgi:probable rRNA maturation factor
MTRATPSTLKIDILIASDRWKYDEKIKAIVRRAVARAAATLSTTGTELAIVLTDDSAIRLLNRDWRGIDAPTNVLSFPAKGARETRLGQPPGQPFGQPLGDIVLAYETIAREARGEGKLLAHHVAHLAVHGFLHLLGFDHERDEDAAAMERAESDILRQLAIPNPYDPPKKRRAKRSTMS